MFQQLGVTRREVLVSTVPFLALPPSGLGQCYARALPFRREVENNGGARFTHLWKPLGGHGLQDQLRLWTGRFSASISSAIRPRGQPYWHPIERIFAILEGYREKLLATGLRRRANAGLSTAGSRPSR